MMLALFAGLGAKLAGSALMMSPIGTGLKAAGGFLKRIPWQVWVAIALAIAFFFAVRHHRHAVEEFGNQKFAAGYAKAIEDGKRRVVRVEQKSAGISTEIRSKSDEEIRHSARRADDLRLRGPGAAACLNPGLPAGAGRHDQASGRAVAAAAGVPQQDRIAVPFDYAVNQAEVGDANRTEVLAWREWHQRLTAEWQKFNAEGSNNGR